MVPFGDSGASCRIGRSGFTFKNRFRVQPSQPFYLDLAVEFIRRGEEQRVMSADVIIGGAIWEMKDPKAPNMKAVEKNLRKAMDQSDCAIFDSRRMKGIPDHAIERELRVCAAGRVKKLRRLLFVNRKAQVIGIK